jgi:hypothetical protein
MEGLVDERNAACAKVTAIESALTSNPNDIGLKVTLLSARRRMNRILDNGDNRESQASPEIR